MKAICSWLLAAAGLAIPTLLQAQAESASGESAPAPPKVADPPCSGPIWWAQTGTTHADFDFWVGEWMVFDRRSGRLNGIDLIEKDLGGCAIKQRWRHMNDDYSLPGASWRMQGTSSSGIAADGLWHQQWLDNNGGYLMMVGQLNEQGEMVLESEWLEFSDRRGRRHRIKHRWHWQPLADGGIHNWGFQRRELPESSDWTMYFDIEYRPIAVGSDSLQRLPVPATPEAESD